MKGDYQAEQSQYIDLLLNILSKFQFKLVVFSPREKHFKDRFLKFSND